MIYIAHSEANKIKLNNTVIGTPRRSRCLGKTKHVETSQSIYMYVYVSNGKPQSCPNYQLDFSEPSCAVQRHVSAKRGCIKGGSSFQSHRALTVTQFSAKCDDCNQPWTGTARPRPGVLPPAWPSVGRTPPHLFAG